MICQRTRECLKNGALLLFKIWNRVMAKKVKPMTKVTAAKAARKLQILYKKSFKKKLTIKELKAMLLYLIDEYASVTYEKNVLTIQTEDILMGYYNKNLGPAIIILDLKRAFEGKNPPYIENSSVKIKGLDGYRFPHRHVYSSSSDMCFGDGYSACRKSIIDGRLDDFFDIMQQMLRT